MDPKRLVAVAAGCLAVILIVPGQGRAAGAHGLPISRCTARSGTLVAVDFAHWNGPIVRGCAVHPPTGYQLLLDAGFTTAGDDHDGSALICRLGDDAFRDGNQYPTPAEDACVVTPPASAYWSQWLAPAGSDRWEYSQVGAMGEAPKPGETQLWVFGATNIAGTRGSGVPRFSPAQLRARAPGATVGASGPRLVDAVAAASHGSSGSALGLVIGICAALAVGGAAGWATWRRRRYE